MELRQREEVAENYAKQEMSWHRNQCAHHTRAETEGENILDVLYASETETDEGCVDDAVEVFVKVFVIPNEYHENDELG